MYSCYSLKCRRLHDFVRGRGLRTAGGDPSLHRDELRESNKTKAQVSAGTLSVYKVTIQI